MKTKSTQNNKAGLKNRTMQVGSETQAAEAVPTDRLPAQIPAPAQPWRGVFFRGPEPVQDNRQEGNELPTWLVFVGNEDAEPRSKVYRVFSYTRAHSLAQSMATDRRLELIDEAQPAGPTAPAPAAAAA